MNATSPTWSDDEDPHVLAYRADAFISQLQLERYGRTDIWAGSESAVAEFVNAYVSGKIFPHDRLREVTLRMIDVRLQIEYIMFDIELMNDRLYGAFAEDVEYQDSARAKIARMALSQSLIGRSRILWERLFRLIYYLEEGRDINRKNGVKTYFFSWASASERWRFMEVYAPLIEDFDRQFRTPEYHKHSVLRAHIMRDNPIHEQEIIDTANYGFRIPENVRSIALTGWNSRFDDLHLIGGDHRNGIDPRYLPPQQEDDQI